MGTGKFVTALGEEGKTVETDGGRDGGSLDKFGFTTKREIFRFYPI